jgi:hypothetical protein
MAMTDIGKNQSDWWVPAVTGGIVGLSFPLLGPWLSPVFDIWYGPGGSLLRTLSQAVATGLMVGGVFFVFARATKAWRRT